MSEQEYVIAGQVVEMVGVEEYCEGMPALLARSIKENRYVVRAYNEAGYNSTDVDLIQLIEWVHKNMPGVIENVIEPKKDKR